MTEMDLKALEPTVPDGRRRRSQESRARVVAAMLDLVRDGDVAPSAERVAARAEVGLRTVFRHFKDMDSLYREMSVVIEGELTTALAIPLTGADWRSRLIELVHKRCLVFEKIAPFKRASNAHRHHSSFLEADHDHMVATARKNLRDILPSEISSDRELIESLDLLLSFEGWSRLRIEQRLSARDTRDAIEFAARKMIAK